VRLRQLCTVLLVAVALGPHAASAAEPSGGEKRIALVIGNADYAAGRLANSVLDARSMAETLRELGFEVLAYENTGYREMRRAVAEFGERLTADGVALFLAAEALDADGVLNHMQEAKTRVNIVILDACRDNPFTTRFRGLARGLAFMPAPAGTYVAYATGPGSVAEDGEPGRNGIYTGELLKALREPGLRIEDVFKRVRIAVQARTENRQNPWDASSMTGDFFFNASASTPSLRVREEVRLEHGELALTSTIDGVEIFVNDQRVGETRRGRVLVIDRLGAGFYRVRAQRPGYRPWTREVQVALNERVEVEIELER